MAEVMSGGYAVEYICRVIDETDGKESIAETTTVAEKNLNGKKKSKGSGKKGAEDAKESKTDAYLNSSLQIAMPALNGLTDGVAGQVIGKSKQVLNLGNKIVSGAGTAAIMGAAAPLIAAAVAKAVQAFQNEKAKNDAIAASIDATNLQRQMAGLKKINYTQSKITRKIEIKETRQ